MFSRILPKHSDLLKATPSTAFWRAVFGDPGSEATIALHIMPKKQPVRSQRFLFDVDANHAESSMHAQAEKARSVNDPGKSDGGIVPLKREDQSRGVKPGNAGAGKAARPSRETDRTSTVLSDGSSVLTRLDRITQRAERYPEERFNNLFSLLTYELLRHAFRKLKRDKAPGVDGITVDQYEVNLRDNLHDLLARLHVSARVRHLGAGGRLEGWFFIPSVWRCLWDGLRVQSWLRCGGNVLSVSGGAGCRSWNIAGARRSRRPTFMPGSADCAGRGRVSKESQRRVANGEVRANYRHGAASFSFR